MVRRPRSGRGLSALAPGVGLIAVLAAPLAVGDSPNFSRPEGHFRVEKPADLEGADATAIYDRIVDDMVAAYAVSRDPTARAYRRWRRYNRHPFRSETHGDRFINHYGNAAADAYGRSGNVGELPVGAVLAKDSFTVTAAGDVFTGPLFVMEKMPRGFDPEARDWRYSMILPDGSFFGVTGGDNAERVEFCITCHQLAGDDHDHLFFVPEEYRVEASE